MNGLSVVVITYNEEHNIARCLDSVKAIADEIVVLDSFSNDATKTIALKMGAKVYEQAFLGYVEQKNKALEYAENNYVLSLDADEVLDETLIQAIKALNKNYEKADVYNMNRCTQYCGKFIRHGAWYPNRRVRLFNKKIAKWGGINPHDVVVFDSANVRKQYLKGDILHYSYNNLEEHIIQNNRFSTISAMSYFKLGRKSGWIKMSVNPFWAFINSYFVRMGFLDGYFGYVIAKNIASLTFMKYYKLYALQNGIPVSPANNKQVKTP
ncbi:glycosyltransferase family 2 protein [Pinibacter soli]|uniref:Glycosyltransferase family 2 protein n=1 Tax=Pinibacter soli TaxID=3044211 RepID=A0ABT6R7U2_9BACT|nr:glycosyltransferase family 2 protein [Pinibacter soli]MDI3318465.1 glycosyltransferase family 2 protein [Pinibacter soli]